MIPLRVYLLLGALILVAIAQGALAWHFYSKGENTVLRKDYEAVVQHDQQVQARADQDKRDAADAITDLKQQLDAARGELSMQPPPRPIRLCSTPGGDPGRPASATAATAQPGEPARPADDRGVLPGDQPGPDVSADVRALKDAGVVLAIYNRALIEWATRQSQPVSR